MGQRIVQWDPSWIADRADTHTSLASTDPGPVELALEGLDERRRAVVELVVFHGLSQAEAGRTLGLTKQRAHVLWHEAIAELAAAVT